MLHDAALVGDVVALPALVLDYGVRHSKHSAMVLAAANGHVSTLQKMVECGLNVDGYDVIMNFRRKWESRKVKKFHQKMDRDMSVYTNGWSPKISAFSAAVFYGQFGAMVTLLANGADIDFDPYTLEDSQHDTVPTLNPVAWALLGRRWDIADFLLDIGSSPPETTRNPLLKRLWDLNIKKRAVGQAAAILDRCRVPTDVIKEICKFV